MGLTGRSERDPFAGVPPKPTHWVQRPAELERLKALVLGAGGGAVGVVSQKQVTGANVGLHGMGGIGKTALAIALLHEPEVRARFPDGIFWATVGQTPQMESVLAALLEQIEGSRPTLQHVGEGVARLKSCLRGRKALLVVDDAWEPEQIKSFDLGLPLLITTRNREVLLAARGAKLCELGLLDESQARRLLASWAGLENVARLPADHSAVIIRECHGHALALELTGAQFFLGSPWGDLAAALAAGDQEFIAQQQWGAAGAAYRSVFRALESSVAALPDADRDAYLALACFPKDEVVPAVMAQILWRVDEREAKLRLARLKQRALLSYADEGFTFHDLQHDYLLAKAGNDRSQLHRRFLDAVEASFGEDPRHWPKGYARNHRERHEAIAAKPPEVLPSDPTPPPEPPRARRSETRWTPDAGSDTYGRFAELVYMGVVQRMRWIPPGKFTMGADSQQSFWDELPVRRVTLSRGFWLADEPCTQELWMAVMGSNPSRSQAQGAKRPVETVSWDDCCGFLESLTVAFEGLPFRLPTEAQWEYACRAGSLGKWCFGNNEALLAEYAWYGGNAHGRPHPVATRKRNSWGLADMHGNVWEWCRDYWQGDYKGARTLDPLGPSRGVYRVVRGGSWFSPSNYCRSASRFKFVPQERSNELGLRFAIVGKAP